MKKIGIITFSWTESNYGQILQNFALQKFLQNNYFYAYTIDYMANKDFNSTFSYKVRCIFNPKKISRFLLSKLCTKSERVFDKRKFSAFKSKYMKFSEIRYKNIEELQKKPPVADIYITGSDQVWNFDNLPIDTISSKLNAFFLNFGSAKKIAFSTSFGAQNITTDFFNAVNPLISKFSMIFVREQSGIDKVERLGYKNAIVALDPTLLLRTEEYEQLIADAKISEKEFDFVYLVKPNNDDSAFNNCRKEIKCLKNRKIFYTTANTNEGREKRDDLSIPDWLYCIKNAKDIYTNSFHCVVFSILFSKKVFFYPSMNKRYLTMNDRIETLVTELGVIYEKNVRKAYFDFSNKGVVDKKLELLRVKYSNLLLEAINK